MLPRGKGHIHITKKGGVVGAMHKHKYQIAYRFREPVALIALNSENKLQKIVRKYSCCTHFLLKSKITKNKAKILSAELIVQHAQC